MSSESTPDTNNCAADGAAGGEVMTADTAAYAPKKTFKDYIPFFAMWVMMIAVQALALTMAPIMNSAGYTAFEDPDAFENTIYFLAILLLFTAAMLLLIKYKGKKILSWIIAASIFLVLVYIFAAIFALVCDAKLLTDIAAILIAVLAVVLLYKYPEWYVIDILGTVICAGTAAIFGISFEIMPVILLLVLLAVYDAISVYKTKHMLTLAESIISTKAPILVVVPKKMNYSYIKEGLEIKKDRTERGAFMMGMGDLIMPSILVVSAYIFVDAPAIAFGVGMPVLTAIIGSLCGLAVLLYFVAKGNAQAGLPTLNGGVIIGFLVGCALSGSWDWMQGIL